MKVGYFVETPVAHNLTGGVRSFLNLIEELLKLGVAPYVVTSEEWEFTDKLKELGVPYLASKMLRPFVGTTSTVRFQREKYWIKTIINNHTRDKATKWFKENGVELVHINSQFAGIIGAQVAQKLKIPYVYHMREYLDRDFFVKFYSEKLVQKYIATAPKVIGISKSIQQYYEQKLRRDVTLVYNGIPVKNENCFSPDVRLSKEQVELAIVGRVNPAKGQLEAVQALKFLKQEYGCTNVRLHIIGYMGKDPYEMQIKQYAEENSILEQVVFHPFTNKPEEILKDCDVGLTCSIAEAFGRVTVEYMLAGLLPVGADTGGTPEIILDGQTGLLYRQGDPEDLAKKLYWVLQNKEEARQMLRAGQKRGLDVFTIRATANNVWDIYTEIKLSR